MTRPRIQETDRGTQGDLKWKICDQMAGGELGFRMAEKRITRTLRPEGGREGT